MRGIDKWDADGNKLIEHLAGLENLNMAHAAYAAAVKKWPGDVITLRNRARVIRDSRENREKPES
jgi:hypothetical protein